MRTQDLVLVQGRRHSGRACGVEPAPVAGAARVAGRQPAGDRRPAAGGVGGGQLQPARPLAAAAAGLNAPAGWDNVLHVLGRNSLVLALHGFACVTGFIAGSSLPLSAERYSGAWRWVHDRAGRAVG